MGTDISIQTEVKFDGKWHHMGYMCYPRDYQFFGYLAGVRDEDIEPLVAPKGLPEDISETTQFIVDYETPDLHTPTWFDANEIRQIENWLVDTRGEYNPEQHWGYLFGNSWGGFSKYPEDRPKGIEDIRFIIWFDC